MGADQNQTRLLKTKAQFLQRRKKSFSPEIVFQFCFLTEEKLKSRKQSKTKMTVLARNSRRALQLALRSSKTVGARRESFLAKLMGLQAVRPDVGTPLMLGYGITVYGAVIYGIQTLPDE